MVARQHFTFDDEGRLRVIDRASSSLATDGVDAFNCDAGNWPLVLGESTQKGGRLEGGSFGATGNGMSREFAKVQISSEIVFLQYRAFEPEYNEEQIHVFLLELNSGDDTLNYYYRMYLDTSEALTLEAVHADNEYLNSDTTLVRCEP